MKRNDNRVLTAARRIRRLCPSPEPEALCRAMDVGLLRMELGADEHSIKGFLLRSSRCTTVVVNSCLPEELQRVIVCHELGHAVLGHARESVCTFQDHFLCYDKRSEQENEANFLAAELLLTDEAVLDALRRAPFDEAAADLRVPPEILDFKCRMLQRRGLMAYDGRAPRTVVSDCLKDVSRGGADTCCPETFT